MAQLDEAISASRQCEDETEIDARAVFASVIIPIMAMSRERPDLSIVAERHIFQGESLSTIAATLRITKQAAHKRLAMACGMVPSLALIAPIDARLYRSGAMMRAMQGKAHIRRPKGHRRVLCEAHDNLFDFNKVAQKKEIPQNEN